MHHLRSVWGEDAEEFIPERWYTISDQQKQAFIPFGIGPRSCSGRNVAEMELGLIIATMIRRYDFELYEDDLVTWEGFLRKPLRCNIGIRRRIS
jgi:benzoate 4-monooxygenase